ncbi:MAG: hypothetical protein J6Q76_06680 [Clostridia bacterium]|nr:hypothetical protein [Clostridia bacterium]
MKDRIDAEKLFETLGEIDQELLAEALETSDEQQLKTLKKSKHKKVAVLHRPFFRVAAAVLCVTVLAALVLAAGNFGLFNHNGNFGDTADNSLTSQTPSDSSELSSSEHTPSKNESSSESSSNPEPDKKPKPKISINSIDMLNFYSAKKIISEKGLLNGGGRSDGGHALPLGLGVIQYEIDRDREFYVSMLTYFVIELDNENGFLATKLGGTGRVEVVITQNSLDDMITFKKGDNYYSCLLNGASNNPNSSELKSMTFSTHKYIEGFKVVKNFAQENYRFKVNYSDKKVTGMECTVYIDSWTATADPDEITVVPDQCVVLCPEQSFTIDQLESYFNKEIGKPTT